MSHDAGAGAIKGVAAQAKKQDACVEDKCNRTQDLKKKFSCRFDI